MSETKLVEYIDHGDSVMVRSASDPVDRYDWVGGQHYDFTEPVNNTIELIETLGLSYLAGHAMKYLCRHGRKPGNDPGQDLQKAINCLWREVYGDWAPLPKGKP